MTKPSPAGRPPSPPFTESSGQARDSKVSVSVNQPGDHFTREKSVASSPETRPVILTAPGYVPPRVAYGIMAPLFKLSSELKALCDQSQLQGAVNRWITQRLTPQGWPIEELAELLTEEEKATPGGFYNVALSILYYGLTRRQHSRQFVEGFLVPAVAQTWVGFSEEWNATTAAFSAAMQALRDFKADDVLDYPLPNGLQSHCAHMADSMQNNSVTPAWLFTIAAERCRDGTAEELEEIRQAKSTQPGLAQAIKTVASLYSISDHIIAGWQYGLGKDVEVQKIKAQETAKLVDAFLPIFAAIWGPEPGSDARWRKDWGPRKVDLDGNEQPYRTTQVQVALSLIDPKHLHTLKLFYDSPAGQADLRLSSAHGLPKEQNLRDALQSEMIEYAAAYAVVVETRANIRGMLNVIDAFNKESIQTK